MLRLTNVSGRGRIRATVIFGSALATLCAATACTLLYEKEPIKCSTSGDCTKFGQSICQNGECVTGNPSTVNDGSVGNNDGEVKPDANPVFDGSDPCLNPNKEIVEFKGDVNENLTLKCDKDYKLVGRVVVVPPFTITITAGTTIYADPTVDLATGTPGTLVIPRGSRIVAIGQADKPIIFTSAKKIANPPVQAASADWGGIFILGEAPVNNVATDGGTNFGTKLGLGQWGEFGGSKPSSDSGQLKFVRIDYAGTKLPNAEDGVALSLAGVGDGTEIDHIMMRFSGDDCAEIRGGSVGIKHMLCQYPVDDGIAWDNGWSGKVQFLVVQGRPQTDNGSNGLQGRSSSGGTMLLPVSSPKIYNATFCGQNSLPATDRTNQQYGIRIENNTQVQVFNSMFLGWEAALDFRNAYIPGAITAGNIVVKHSLAFGNVAFNIAYPETSDAGTSVSNPFSDDDTGFDEVAYFRTPANLNSETDPGLGAKPFSATGPRFAASTPIGRTPGGAGSPNAVVPPNDGFFDTTANYIGAFRDESDGWAVGRWVLWDEK